ncbi:MAG: chorismate mutase [candidate division BRC1 bacterium ADurb.BinA364]|nr:MAG: chorismate mutase [candidate division BRC1 bacterium ADurb.BinA364]
MTDELDLHGSIRPGLDLLANEIVISLKRRSGFKQNPEIYRPGLVLGQPERSLLDYELEVVERVHAELGRYRYATYDSFSNLGPVPLIIKRQAPKSPIRNWPTGMGPRIKQLYIDWTTRACEPGSDYNTYGETVTADVNALINIHERVAMGKTVAESKYQSAPQAYLSTAGDREAIRRLLVNPEREERVIDLARELAARYLFSQEQAVEIFRLLIDATVEVEIDYLSKRIAEQLAPQ